MDLIAALLLVLSSSITHDVSSSKFVKGGEIQIAVSDATSDSVTMTMDYYLKMKWYAPVKDQRGKVSADFPADFLTVDGYLDIEKNGPRDFKDVVLTHMGRRPCLNFAECHILKIEHKDKKWDAIVDYNPAVASTGWATMELTYHDIPVLGSQTVNSHLRQ